jgi:hypothetical protein
MFFHQRAEEHGRRWVREGDVGILIGFDKKSERLGQVGQGMRFSLADFVYDLIENSHCSVIVLLGPQWTKWDPLSNTTVIGVGFANVLGEHRSGPPRVPVVFRVCEYVLDVQLPSVVMNGCNQPELISADIEYGKPIDLIGRRKSSLQVGE